MSPTNAERQATYRKRHLVDGAGARINLVVSAAAKAQLARLARHRGTTQRELLEMLLTKAEAAATRRMAPAAKTAYFREE